MRSRSNGGVIGAYALPTQNYANGVFFIHDAAIYNTGPNPIWPLGTGFIYSATGGTIGTATDNANYKTHTFTANGTFTVVNGSGELEILLVGGGGSGGIIRNNSGTQISSLVSGGGGGGGVTVVSTWVEPGTTFTVTVGQGAVVNTTSDSNLNADPGGQSIAASNRGHSYNASGGASATGIVRVGSITRTRTATNGASGAGGSAFGSSSSAYSQTATNILPPQMGYNGGASDITTSGTTYQAGGGGGGAMGLGKPGLYGFTVAQSGYGGDGYLWPRTNSYYGAGGAGARGYFWCASNGVTPGTRARPGLCGPADTAATQTAGHGGAPTTTSGTSPGTVGLAGYGGGGGGSIIPDATTTSISYLTSGGGGAVIFCYRYQ